MKKVLLLSIFGLLIAADFYPALGSSVTEDSNKEEILVLQKLTTWNLRSGAPGPVTFKNRSVLIIASNCAPCKKLLEDFRTDAKLIPENLLIIGFGNAKELKQIPELPKYPIYYGGDLSSLKKLGINKTPLWINHF